MCKQNEKRVFSNDKVNKITSDYKIIKVIVDLSKTELLKQQELERTKHQMPVNIIYPSNPKMPGVLLTGTFGSAEALKALKYVTKNSKF